MKVTFWLESPSPHQAALIRNLADRPGLLVTVVAERPSSDRRKKMGWATGNFGKAAIYVAPTHEERLALESELLDSDVHIVTGVFSYPAIASTTRRLLNASRVVLCQTERWDNRGVKGFLRFWRYKLRLAELARYQNAGVLAMGSSGVDSIVGAGFPRERTAEFGYFVDAVPGLPSATRRGVVYVGELAAHKGVMHLLDAAGGLVGVDLVFIGTGPLEERCRELAKDMESVSFSGVVENSRIGEVIAEHSVLVLPSLYDGWGAVVNEALLVGTPVVCTEEAGASSLLNDVGPRRGFTVRAGDSQALRSSILSVVSAGGTTIDHSDVMRWASEHISPAAGADYVQELCERVRLGASVNFDGVVAPWRRGTR